MLALKLALRRADEVATYVFDEVDAGIGGATAQVVGVADPRRRGPPPGAVRDPPAADRGVRRPPLPRREDRGRGPHRDPRPAPHRHRAQGRARAHARRPRHRRRPRRTPRSCSPRPRAPRASRRPRRSGRAPARDLAAGDSRRTGSIRNRPRLGRAQHVRFRQFVRVAGARSSDVFSSSIATCQAQPSRSNSARAERT